MLTSPNHLTVTQGFIHDFFGLEVELDQIHLQSPYSFDVVRQIANQHLEPEQATRMFQTERDISIRVHTSDLIVELQVRREPHFLRRALYYLCRRYVDHYRPAVSYSSLVPVYALNVTGFRLFDCEHSFHRFELNDSRGHGHQVIDDLTVSFLEYRKHEFDNERQAWWCQFLSGQELSDQAPAYLQEAANIINYANLEPEERVMIDVMEKYETTLRGERQAAREDGWEEGHAEGREEGREEERSRFLKAARAAGVSEDQIARLVELAEAESD
jgi:predicted transposase/invertase (TIGR01784 family)